MSKQITLSVVDDFPLVSPKVLCGGSDKDDSDSDDD
jgi:hypothetical protein